jgi:hypothetical protein
MPLSLKVRLAPWLTTNLTINSTLTFVWHHWNHWFRVMVKASFELQLKAKPSWTAPVDRRFASRITAQLLLFKLHRIQNHSNDSGLTFEMISITWMASPVCFPGPQNTCLFTLTGMSVTDLTACGVRLLNSGLPVTEYVNYWHNHWFFHKSLLSLLCIPYTDQQLFYTW